MPREVSGQTDFKAGFWIAIVWVLAACILGWLPWWAMWIPLVAGASVTVKK